MRFASPFGRLRLATAFTGIALLTLICLSDSPVASHAHAGPAMRGGSHQRAAAVQVEDMGLGEETSVGTGPPMLFRSGNLRIRFRGVETNQSYNRYIASIMRPGRQAVTLRFESSAAGCCTIAVKRLDRAGTRYVMISGYSGGSHCCSEEYIVAPDAHRPRVQLLGSFDAAPSSVHEERDIDGDGAVDFLRSDNAFDYAFAGYQASELPPQIWNLIDGRLVDVSSTRSFRPVFVHFMAEERGTCLQGDPMTRNAACAAYVAAAARIGAFGAAWRLMLGAYVRDDVIEGRTFPRRLRALLIAHHYISRRERIPPAVI
jgi:hypothetical protein